MLMVEVAVAAEEALSLCVLSAHTYMVGMHGEITPGLTDYIASELVPVSNSGHSLSLLVVVGVSVNVGVYVPAIRSEVM